MVWALTHVVHPGDSITLLALLAGGNRGNSFISASPVLIRISQAIDECPLLLSLLGELLRSLDFCSVY